MVEHLVIFPVHVYVLIYILHRIRLSIAFFVVFQASIYR